MIKVTFTPHLNRFTHVNLNGEPWRTLASSLLKGASGLAASYSSLQVWTNTWNEWEAKKVKAIAYYKLSQKQYFSEELQKKLLSLGFLESAVEKALQEISSFGYLNDAENVESLISRAVRLRKGPRWIQQKLFEKGIHLPQNLEEYYPKKIRLANIRDLMQNNRKEKQKVIASLIRKGYLLEDIISVYNN